jgi:hypothetical protein
MKIISCSLRDELGVDFSRVSAQLTEAKLRQEQKDTSANRAAVAECWTRIDAVLDMYLLDIQLRKVELGRERMPQRSRAAATNHRPYRIGEQGEGLT